MKVAPVRDFWLSRSAKKVQKVKDLINELSINLRCIVCHIPNRKLHVGRVENKNPSQSGLGRITDLILS